MTIKLIFALAVIVSLTAPTGCLRPETREFTARDSGRTVTLPIGTHFTVRLASNVSTGYGWQLTALDQAVVRNTGNHYIAPEAPLPGAGGVEEWDFAVQATGTTTLEMEYRRPWEQGAPPVDTFELTVVVTDA
jgi:inhibitor of cysteine peptidase